MDSIAISVAKSIGKKIRLGTLLRHLTFINLEQLEVGQIVDDFSNENPILIGSETFEIDGSGNITFKVLPDYDVQRTYTLKVKSNTGKIYIVAIYVTIFTTATLFTGTELMYNDTYIKAA